MPVIFALLLVVLAGPASAGELVRYRTADGSVGFVDDERRLPPDATIVSRSPLTPPRVAVEATMPDPAGPAEPVEQRDAASDEIRDCASYPERSDQLECRRRHGERCRRFGLSLRCSPETIAVAESWCERGASLRDEWTPIEERLATAVENHRACKSGARPGADCSREEVLDAEREVEVWDLRLSALEEQCHEQGCMPGWIRESCEVSARR